MAFHMNIEYIIEIWTYIISKDGLHLLPSYRGMGLQSGLGHVVSILELICSPRLREEGNPMAYRNPEDVLDYIGETV